MTSDAEVRRWRWARSLDDLAGLSKDWLEGSLGFHPISDLWDLDDSLKADLLPLVEIGFVPIYAQRATARQRGKGRREWISGFCSSELLGSIAKRLVGTELVSFEVVPGTPGFRGLVTSIEDAPRHAGFEPRAATFKAFAAVCRPETVGVLRRSWCLEVIDPVWGRQDRLWEALRGVGDTTAKLTSVL